MRRLTRRAWESSTSEGRGRAKSVLGRGVTFALLAVAGVAVQLLFRDSGEDPLAGVTAPDNPASRVTMVGVQRR